VLLGMVSFLVARAFQRSGHVVHVETKFRLDESAAVGERFVLPFDVQNRGERTLTLLAIELSYRDSRGRPVSEKIELKYLGEESRQTVYLYTKDDPRTLRELEARPAYYQLD